MYFQNYRFESSKSVETGISHSKLPEVEEAIALTTEDANDEVKTELEMDKVKTGSSEALIVTGTEGTVVPDSVEVVIDDEAKQEEAANEEKD